MWGPFDGKGCAVIGVVSARLCVCDERGAPSGFCRMKFIGYID